MKIWILLTWLCLCSLSTAIHEVTSITLFMANDKEADLGKTLYITLWFNFTIYQYSIDNPRKGVTYSSTSSGAFSTLGSSDCHKPQYNNAPETKIMFENNDADYVIVEKVSFHTASGIWYGIDAICLTQDVINFVKSTPYKSALIGESGCSSGQALQWMCVTNKKSAESCSLGDYQMIVYFDITRPNQFIPNAQFITDNSLFPQIKTCDPTYSPTAVPTIVSLTSNPTISPEQNTIDPTFHPSINPTFHPSINPTFHPSINPTFHPSINPTFHPSINPSFHSSMNPTFYPTINPSSPTFNPSSPPSPKPPLVPTMDPSSTPIFQPTRSPTIHLQPSTISPTLNVLPTIAPTMHLPSKPGKQPTIQTTRFYYYYFKQPTIEANSKNDTSTTHTKTTDEKEYLSTSAVVEDAPKSSNVIALTWIVIAIVALVVIVAVMVYVKSRVDTIPGADKKPRTRPDRMSIRHIQYNANIQLAAHPANVQQNIYPVCQECGDVPTKRDQIYEEGPWLCVTCRSFDREGGKLGSPSTSMYAPGNNKMLSRQEGKLRASRARLSMYGAGKTTTETDDIGHLGGTTRDTSGNIYAPRNTPIETDDSGQLGEMGRNTSGSMYAPGNMTTGTDDMYAPATPSIETINFIE